MSLPGQIVCNHRLVGYGNDGFSAGDYEENIITTITANRLNEGVWAGEID